MREALKVVGVILGFVGFGLGWAAVEEGAGAGDAAYADVVVDEAQRADVWLVDGFNVLHVGLLRGRERGAWWSGAARARLLERVARFDADGGEVWVVFDGERPLAPGSVPDRGPRVVFSAPADDWLLARLREVGDPTRVALVTADHRLADRARRRGARIVPPHAFLARCGAS